MNTDSGVYDSEVYDAICHYVNGNPGCTASEVGEKLFDTHYRGPWSFSYERLTAHKRDWARGLLRTLEKDGHMYSERDGGSLYYYLVDEDEDDEDNE